MGQTIIDGRGNYSGTAFIAGVTQDNYLMVVGSIVSTPSISVNTGSEVYVKGGSIQTYNPLGSTFIQGSIYVTGSINIATNLPTIGSYTTQMISGLQYSVGVSGLMVISGIVNQGTSPWVVSGITNLGTSWTGTGSVVISGIAQVEGKNAEGTLASASKPVVVAFKQFGTDNATIPHVYSSFGLNFMPTLLFDPNLSYPLFDGNRFSGSIVNMPVVRVQGDAGHNQADIGSPVKIGGKVTSGDAFPSSVSTDANRTDGYFDENGYQHIKNEPFRTARKTLFTNQTFYSGTAVQNITSGSIMCARGRFINVYISLAESGTAVDMRLIPQFLGSGTTWYDWSIGPWTDMRYSASQTSIVPITEVMPLDYCIGSYFRVIGSGTMGATGSFYLNLEAEVIS